MIEGGARVGVESRGDGLLLQGVQLIIVWLVWHIAGYEGQAVCDLRAAVRVNEDLTALRGLPNHMAKLQNGHSSFSNRAIIKLRMRCIECCIYHQSALLHSSSKKHVKFGPSLDRGWDSQSCLTSDAICTALHL